MASYDTKQWYESKTLRANILAIVCGAGLIISGEAAAGIPITVVGVLNAFLRTITEKGVSFN